MQELTAGILGNTAAPTGKINGKMTPAQQVRILAIFTAHRFSPSIYN